MRRRRTGRGPAAGGSVVAAGLCLATLAVLACAAGGSRRAAPSPGAPGGAHADPVASKALDRADLELARGDAAAAERDYLEVLDAWPDDPWALAGLVRVALAGGDVEAALAWDERARGSGVPGELGAGERCALWRSVAEARLAAGKAAARDLVERIERDGRCPQGDLPRLRARLLLSDAVAAHARGDLEAALGACAEAVEADPTWVEADVAAARWLLADGRRRDALAWLGVALERHPDDAALRRLMLEALGVPGLGA